MQFIICGTLMPEEIKYAITGASVAGGNSIRKMGYEVAEFSYNAYEGAKQQYLNKGIDCNDVVFKDKTIVYSIYRFQRELLSRLEKDDVVIFYNIVYYDLGLVRKISKKGNRSILILADFTESSSELKSLGHKWIAHLTKRDFKLFDNVVVLSETSKKLFSEKANIVCIEGAVDPRDYDAFVPSEVKGAVKLMYSGNLASFAGVDILLKAFEKVDSERIRLYISGRGELEQEVIDASKRDLRIVYLGFLDKEGYRNALLEANVLVNPRNMNWGQNNYNFPSKVLEYIAAGRPIISTKFSGYEKFLKYATFVDSNSDSLAGAIKQFERLTNQELLDVYRESRGFINDYSWDNQVKKIIELVLK